MAFVLYWNMRTIRSQGWKNWSGLTTTSASSLSTQWCIPLGLRALCMFTLFKCSLTWFSSTKVHLSCSNLSCWSLGIPELCRFSKGWGEDLKYLSLVLHHQNMCPFQQQVHIFKTLLFAPQIVIEAFLVALDILCQSQFWMALTLS